jgi:hypothetical protein
MLRNTEHAHIYVYSCCPDNLRFEKRSEFGTRRRSFISDESFPEIEMFTKDVYRWDQRFHVIGLNCQGSTETLNKNLANLCSVNIVFTLYALY